MNQILECNCKLRDVLRDAIPVEGLDFARMVAVHLQPGERVPQHQHKAHAALYYPADAGPITVTPIAGMVIYLPPGTPHAVPRVKAERVSVAMLVEPNEDNNGTR